MRKIVAILLMGFGVAGIGGCAQPVYNVKDAPVTRNLAAAQVRLAILRAGATLGWQMQDVQPNLIEGTLYLRSHKARVDIPYRTGRYSIVYKDSVNLLYDGTNIHKNYNGWIKNLDRAIQAQLGME
jgi:hypothetical protein